MKHWLLIVPILLCSVLNAKDSAQAPFKVDWQLTDADNAQKYTRVELTLTNLSGDTIYGRDWCILYSLMSLHPTHQDSVQLQEEIVQGTLHRLSPTAFFEPLPPGQSRVFPLTYYRVYIVHDSWRPEMFAYLSLSGENAAEPVALPFTLQPLPEDCPQAWQFTRYMGKNDSIPYASGENLYRYYQAIGDTLTQGLHLLPMPKSIRYKKGTCSLLRACIKTKHDGSLPNEGYRIRLNNKKVNIHYADSAGLFYANQTLQQLIHTGQTVVPNAIIEDAPEYHYRGFLLDIARNFLPKEQILSILQTMCELKLNRMQLHFTDDEAWRIEIPSFPQLTQFGSKREYSGTKEDPFAETTGLYPQFGDAIDNHNAPGSGYLTREDFIDILRFAKERYIDIIPEVDMPGHMRAAKMALRPLLSDSAMDARSYMSAQEFTDCVIDVTSPFALSFVQQVVEDIQSMYREADCELSIFNIGGDEVPKGALTKEEHTTFTDSVVSMLHRHHLRSAGWEEFTHYCPASRQPLCVYWHHRPSFLMQLIDSGYPIIIARNDRLYMDFAYANHEHEDGSTRVCDEFRIFNWYPEQDLEPNYAARLKNHVVGVQASLWGETLRSACHAQTYIYPKIFGFAERAWNPHSSLSLAQLSEHIYRYVLPYYVSLNYCVHVPMPSIHIDTEGRVTMFTPAHAAAIYYTLDGSEPTSSSLLYKDAFVLPKGFNPSLIRAKAFYGNGASGTVRY